MINFGTELLTDTIIIVAKFWGLAPCRPPFVHTHGARGDILSTF